MKFSSIAIFREKTSPAPLSQVSVTGVPTVSSAPAGAVHWRVRARGRDVGRVADPAELGEVAVRSADRRKEDDGRARRVDRLVEVVEAKVVDPAADEVDRAGDARGRDLDARRKRKRSVAGEARRLGADGRRGSAVDRGRGLRRRGRRRRAAGIDRRFGDRLRWRGNRGGGEEILPADENGDRQHDGDDEVLVVHHVHVVDLSPPILSCRPSALKPDLRSSMSRSNGRVKAARRPIKT